jgi:hypothetical protein
MLEALAFLVLQDPVFHRLSERARLRYLELALLAHRHAAMGGKRDAFICNGQAMPLADLAWSLAASEADLSADLHEMASAGLLPPDLPPGAAYFAQAFEQAALTPLQLRTLAELESRYGAARLAECIDWAANSGIAANRAVQALKSALRNWRSPETDGPPRWAGRPAQPAGRPGDELSGAPLDPDLEYLNVNPFGVGRAGVIERLKQKGLLPPELEQALLGPG